VGAVIKIDRAYGSLPAVISAGAAGEFSFHHRSRFVHGERSSADFFPIVDGDRLFGVFIAHGNETESFRAPGVAVRNKTDGFDRTDLLEKGAEFFFCRSKPKFPLRSVHFSP